MKPVFLVAMTVFVTLALACGGDERPPGEAGSASKFVGGPCMNNSECEFTLCQDGRIAPGGTCTSSCAGDSNCSAGSSCIATILGWVCLVNCNSDADCRTDYACEQLTKAPPPSGDQEPSFTNACIGAL